MSEERQPNRYRQVAIAVMVLVFGGLLIRMLTKDSNSGGTSKNTVTDLNENTLATALYRLEKDSDLNTCRDVLQTIDLGVNSGDPRPEPSPNELQPVGQFARLTPEEVNWLANRDFTQLDPDYLVECLLLRDAARSLEIDPGTRSQNTYSPEAKARIAFDWVCRQVYLIEHPLPQPRWVPIKTPVLPAPPRLVLEDGSGLLPDRVMVFLALLQQVQLDGCLIGPPELTNTPSYMSPRNKGQAPTIAPIRAVGVRVGKDILLFDPSLGKPVFTKGNEKIATLAQVRANSTIAKEWLDTAKINADEVKSWEVFVSAPVPSFAPRMEWLQKQIDNMASNKVVLASRVLEMRDRFEKEALAVEPLKGLKCQYWNAPNDPFSPTRILANYDREERIDGAMRNRLKELFGLSRFPLAYVPAPDTGGVILHGRPFETIEAIFRGEFASVLLTAGSPRDLMLRGQFGSALASLESLDRTNASYRNRIAREENLDSALKEWSEKANPVYAEVLNAERSGDPNAINQAKKNEENFRKSRESERLMMYIRRNTSLLLSAEANYLMALVVHERAERFQARIDYGSGKKDNFQKDATRTWANAATNWETFLTNYPELADYYKDRFAHARKLQQEARQYAGEAKK